MLLVLCGTFRQEDHSSHPEQTFNIEFLTFNVLMHQLLPMSNASISNSISGKGSLFPHSTKKRKHMSPAQTLSF